MSDALPRARRFAQLDVFASTPFSGNPLAVVLDGDELTDARMLAFTRWTGLSEATFLLPPTHPEADYRVRIFWPGGELPFAGHPTLGSAQAWLDAGGKPFGDTIVQECGAGLVRIRREAGRLAFAAPPLRCAGPLPEDELAHVTAALGLSREEILDHAWCDNGPAWRALRLASPARLLALAPDAARWHGLEVGLVAAWPDGAGPGGCGFEVRAFFPGASGPVEDPVTGSLNAGLAQWLIAAGHAPACYVAAQGTAMGRAGRVHVHRDDAGTVWVGGETRSTVTGTVRL